jgi:hypothetical protein
VSILHDQPICGEVGYLSALTAITGQ